MNPEIVSSGAEGYVMQFPDSKCSFFHARLLSVCALSLAIAACGGGSDGAGAGAGDIVQTDETKAPSPDNTVANSGFGVASASPDSRAVKRALTSSIKVVFTKPLLAESIDPSAFGLKGGGGLVDFSISYSPGSNLLELVPVRSFNPDTVYTVLLGTELMSADGENLAPVNWQFTTAADIGKTSQETVDSCMTDENISMLAAVNAARTKTRSCGGTGYSAAPALSWSCKLKSAALQHSLDMARQGVLSHAGSDGSRMEGRISANGYRWQFASENVASGYNTVTDVVSGWIASPGHCANIMSSSATEMGSAAAFPASGSLRSRKFWTQNFARPKN